MVVRFTFPVRLLFYISFTFIYTTHKKKANKDVLNWLSARVCSWYVLKILVKLSLNALLKKGSYKKKVQINTAIDKSKVFFDKT